MRELRYAARLGDLDTVSLYKRQRDRVNEAGPDSGKTALHQAACGGHPEVAAFLLKAAKAEVDPLDFNHDTPLNLAVQTLESPLSKKLLLIDLLLAHGADVTLRNARGETPLMNLVALSRQLATGSNFHREVLRGIMRKVDKNLREKAERLDQSFIIHPDGEVSFQGQARPYAFAHMAKPSFT